MKAPIASGIEVKPKNYRKKDDQTKPKIKHCFYRLMDP